MQPLRQNIWVWAIGVSVLAHLILVLAISTTTVNKVVLNSERRPPTSHRSPDDSTAGSRAPEPSSEPVAQTLAPANPTDAKPANLEHARREPQAPSDPASLKKLMTDQQSSSANLTTQQKLDTVHDKAGSLAKMDSSAVSAITSSIEIAQGVDQERAVEPKAGVGGSFDAESALLCDIQRISPDPKSGPAYRWTMVDKAGRSMTYDMPARDMTSENMTAFNVFESARENPNLHALLGTVLRMADKKISEK